MYPWAIRNKPRFTGSERLCSGMGSECLIFCQLHRAVQEVCEITEGLLASKFFSRGCTGANSRLICMLSSSTCVKCIDVSVVHLPGLRVDGRDV